MGTNRNKKDREGGLKLQNEVSPVGNYQAIGDLRRQRGGRGVIKLEKWGNVIYGWSLS